MVEEKNPRTLVSDRAMNRLKSICVNLVLIIGAIVMLTPLLWMLATALSPIPRFPPPV